MSILKKENEKKHKQSLLEKSIVHDIMKYSGKSSVQKKDATLITLRELYEEHDAIDDIQEMLYGRMLTKESVYMLHLELNKYVNKEDTSLDEYEIDTDDGELKIKCKLISSAECIIANIII